MAKKIKKLVKKVVKKAKKKAKPLTAEQKKIVIILSDALAQLKVEAYNANPGSYISIDLDEAIGGIKNSDNNKELKAFLPKLVTSSKPCNVCAKGAIFLSGVRKYNNFTIGDAKECSLDDVAGNKARDLVGYENADLMEQYFEGWDDDGTGQADEWEEKYPDPTDRLIAILKNAIKNKGTFTP